jgi:formylglycine-generating enzyme required for sulfatase activity
MAVYDHGGERARRWNMPARLTIESTPAGASVTLERYVIDEQRKRRLGDARALGTTPIAAVELAPGSYLLTLRSHDRPEVRYPLVLDRGEDLAVTVPVPRAADIPDGFVYVPPGRFLFGSAADEMIRQEFLHAVPLHQVTTGAYLIARHETTYADWLEYLHALPPEQRDRSSIVAGRGAMSGTVSLLRQPDNTWQLTLQPTVEAYTARAGEPFIYPSRKRRARQDWLRFPVSGISHSEARAYADWLAASGRVPGARLCSEYEWERAARGADARTLPHGDRLDPDDANYDETYDKESASMGPDEVGVHPISRSPFGVEDMAGNVFEWAQSSSDSDKVVVRGGAYFYDQTTAQTTNRFLLDSSFQDPTIGLRICAKPIFTSDDIE